MPVPIIVAGIGLAGAVGGAVVSGNAAKSAAKTQAQAAADQRAQNEAYNQAAEARYAGDIAVGDKERDVAAGLLGTGGDAAASKSALDTWRNSVSYQDTQSAALKSVNANAYAQGFGRSGAALKALEDRSAMLANQNQQTYLGNLNNQVQIGSNGKAAITGAATQALVGNNAAIQNSANASSNASLATGAAWTNALQNITNLAGTAYQSSYGNRDKAPTGSKNAWGVSGSDGIY